jgi:glutathione S-transferase
MVLIGMTDSPFVRRVAISMKLLGLDFEHRHVSVFRQMDEFSRVNPVLKAPSFVCDDGTVLMDSTLILEEAEALAAPERRLMPREGRARREALRRIGLGLAACDKAVQVHYELTLRPAEKRHAPWIERVTAQALAAYAGLEACLGDARPWFGGQRPDAADIMTAVAWRFGQHYTAEQIPAARFPALVEYSRRAEALPEFLSTPLD